MRFGGFSDAVLHVVDSFFRVRDEAPDVTSSLYRAAACCCRSLLIFATVCLTHLYGRFSRQLLVNVAILLLKRPCSHVKQVAKKSRYLMHVVWQRNKQLSACCLCVELALARRVRLSALREGADRMLQVSEANVSERDRKFEALDDEPGTLWSLMSKPSSLSGFQSTFLRLRERLASYCEGSGIASRLAATQVQRRAVALPSRANLIACSYAALRPWGHPLTPSPESMNGSYHIRGLFECSYCPRMKEIKPSVCHESVR